MVHLNMIRSRHLRGHPASEPIWSADPPQHPVQEPRRANPEREVLATGEVLAKAKVRHDEPHCDHGRHPFQELLSTSGSSDAPRWSEHLLWVCCILLLWRNVVLLHLAVVNFAFCRGLEDCLDLSSSSMWTSSGQYPTGTPPTEESGPLAENTLSLQFLSGLMDRAARSPFHCGTGHVGVRARANARLSCGAALAHWPLLDSNRMAVHTAMCAGGVLVLLSISLLLLLLTPAMEGVELFMRLPLWLPINADFYFWTWVGGLTRFEACAPCTSDSAVVSLPNRFAIRSACATLYPSMSV